MKPTFPALVALLATPAFAESAREMDAHEHGVGELNIAVDGDTVAMELHAPGADIVGSSTKPKAPRIVPRLMRLWPFWPSRWICLFFPSKLNAA